MSCTRKNASHTRMAVLPGAGAAGKQAPRVRDHYYSGGAAGS